MVITLRILCLGIGNEKDKRYKYIQNNVDPPTIFDYDYLILNLPAYMELSHMYRTLAQKRPEFDKFFENNGVCVVISEKRDIFYESSNYDWCPFVDKFKIENKYGETITFLDKRSRFIFENVTFTWNHYFTNITIDHTVLATNRANDPISILVPYRSGYCIFLPNPDKNFVNLEKLHELLLSRGLQLIPERVDAGNIVTLPSWAKLIASQRELSLLEKYNKLSEQIGKYSKFKQLYWESGDSLENLVIEALKELGLEVTKLPKGSHADFEVKLNGDLIAVSETKGLAGSATLQDLRQLLDYYTEQRDIEKRSVKGIFIVNHYRNEEPSKRGDPLTKDANDLMSKHGFQLLTTAKLYELLEKHWNNEITKEYLISLLAGNL